MIKKNHILLILSFTICGLTSAQDITANFSNTSVCFNNPTCFTDLSTSNNGPITVWSWNFGDPSGINISNLQNPCHTYSAPGTYTVTLIVTNTNGDKDTVNHPVTVNTCVGVQTIYENELINIFPNPFSIETTFQTDKIFKYATLTVYNSYFRQVKQIKNISGRTITLHHDNLPSGLYFIRLTQDNKIIMTNKFVITD